MSRNKKPIGICFFDLKFFSSLILSLLFAVTTFAQSSGNFQITNSIVAGGGGVSTNANTKVEGTVGQPFAGASSNGGTFTLSGGFSVVGSSINTVNMVVNDAQASEPATGSIPMLFTVALSRASSGSVSVSYETTDQTPGIGHAVGGPGCGGIIDYQTTSGTLTFNTGERLKTISVPICADNTSAESDETFLLNLSGANGATLIDAQAQGTIKQSSNPGTTLISELRTSGPGGSGDDFVELYNNSDSPVTVAANDASAGWGLFKIGADCNAPPVLVATILNGTVLPARGHYLIVGSQYSLSTYAAGDQTLTSDIETDRNVAIFSTSNVTNLSTATRIDAVGFGSNVGGVCDLLREGSALPPMGSTFPALEYSFFRKECDFVDGVGCTTAGTPKDTNDNSADFKFTDTAGTTIPGGPPAELGAPGPEALGSPIRRDSTIAVMLLDSSVPSSAAPNRFRDLTSNPGNGSIFGTLSFRRRIQNNTGATITRLRFRIVEITTFPSTGGQADLRAITSLSASVMNVHDAAACAAAQAGSPPCTLTVQGSQLEQPPSQPNGGGFNSTMLITTGVPLQDRASLDVQLVVGVQQPGKFRFLLIVEALP
jgi:Calx-beta domain-containing protein